MSRNRSHDGSSLNPATVIFAALAARSISNGLLATDRSASIESSRQASCALRPSGQVSIQNCSLIGRPQYMQGLAWISRQRAWLCSLIDSHLGEETPGTISRSGNAEPGAARNEGRARLVGNPDVIRAALMRELGR